MNGAMTMTSITKAWKKSLAKHRQLRSVLAGAIELSNSGATESNGSIAMERGGWRKLEIRKTF